MKVLRLGQSDQRIPGVPDSSRTWFVAQEVLAAAIGEPVETVLREIWPQPSLPDLVDRWIERYQPDLVFMKTTDYWVCTQSVPLRLQRRFGKVGRKAGDLGKRAADVPRIAHTRLFHAGRLVLLRTIGGDRYFEPADVVATLEACLRRIVAHETVVPVVSGTVGMLHPPYGWGGEKAAIERRTAVHEGMARVCGQLHIAYTGRGGVIPKDEYAGLVGGDGLHRNEAGQQAAGAAEGRQMVRAWLAAREGVSPTA